MNGKLIYPSSSSGESKRKTLLSSLRRCLPGQWIRVEALLFALWKQAPLSLYDPHHKQTEPISLQERRKRWMTQGDGQVYLGLLTSLIYEAGIVLLGSDRPHHTMDDVPEFFQVTPLGAAALADSGTHALQVHLPLLSASGQLLIVQPSFECLVFQFDPQIIYRIMQFAQIKQIGAVSRFTLTQPALLRGMEAGNQVESILAFLTRHAC